MCSEGQSKRDGDKHKKQSGQLILEYVLLMIIAVSMATLMKSQLIGGDPSDPSSAGVLSQMVYGIAHTIAVDTPGE